MGGFTLVAVHQHAPVARSLIESRMFWFGVLLAVVLTFFFRWAALVLLLLALFASGLLRWLSEALHAHSFRAIFLVIAVIGFAVGLFFGQRRGLRVLADSEFKARLNGIHDRVTRWF